MRQRLWVLSMLMVLGTGAAQVAGTAQAATLYVDAAVATTGNGSLASPFKTIGEAMTASAGGDEIRIAGGLYDKEPADMPLKGEQMISGSYDSAFTGTNFAENPTIIDMRHLTLQEQDRTFRCQAVASFTIENLVIKNSSTGESNNTTNGGAILVQNGSTGVIRHVSFIHCTSKFEGGLETGPARDAGALCIRDASSVVVEDCVFDRCTAVGNGGAIAMRNAGGGNNVKIRRCVFTKCGSRNGASAINDQDGVSQIEIVNCLFVDNGVDVVVPSGTAPSNYEIRVADKRALIYNCTFVGSNNPDGFMFDLRDSSDGSATKKIVNCIIANNTIASGGTVFAIFSYPSGYNDATTLQNNLFFSNSGLDPLDPTGANIIGANGNIAGDPQFTDAANGDYHLKAGSPGVEAGQTLALVPDDFAGTARPVGSAYDIGALEGQVTYKVGSVIATATSSFSTKMGPEKTVDESGLNALGQHDTIPAHMWLSAVDPEPPVRIQYQFDTVYKLDQMWVWNSNTAVEPFPDLGGYGVKTATMEYSTDGATWTSLADVPEFAQAPGTADYLHDTTVDFGGVAAKFVRLTITSSWGGTNQCGLSEVRFYYIPVFARDPSPATGATDVPIDTSLSWRAGCEADLHEVYLGTDPNALTPADTASTTSYTPADLLLGTRYYWRVDEVNDAQTPAVWPGNVWTFTTADFLVVDDFESYNDEEGAGTRIYETWIDGFTDNSSGSTVGHIDPPFAERTFVHGGRQSMPFAYDNTTTFSFSEAVRTFDTPQDWTRGGIRTLVLFFQGEPNNVSGALYLKINNTKVSYNGNASDLTSSEWKQWNVDLPAAAGLGAVKALTIGVAGGQGVLYLDDIRLYHSAP